MQPYPVRAAASAARRPAALSRHEQTSAWEERGGRAQPRLSRSARRWGRPPSRPTRRSPERSSAACAPRVLLSFNTEWYGRSDEVARSPAACTATPRCSPRQPRWSARSARRRAAQRPRTARGYTSKAGALVLFTADISCESVSPFDSLAPPNMFDSSRPVGAAARPFCSCRSRA